jgi:hypothetical protein
MGIDVRVEDENRELEAELLDGRGLVVKLLPGEAASEYPCLRFIEPYGDATFNQLQVPHLITELGRRIELTRDEAVRDHGKKLLALVQSAEGRSHTYVRFIGD